MPFTPLYPRPATQPSGLRRWHSGGQPSAGHLNEPVDWINDFAQAQGLGTPGGADDPFSRPFLAKIVDTGPNGESALSGAMYWVRKEYVGGAASANALTTTPTIYEDKGNAAYDGKEFNIFPALNLGEYQSATHYVETGEEVWVFPIYAAGSPAKKQGEAAEPPQRRLIFAGPQPTVRDIRYNPTTHTLQVSYLWNPEEDDWVDKITFTAC